MTDRMLALLLLTLQVCRVLNDAEVIPMLECLRSA